MEFICKKEYALTSEERELVGDMIFADDYTQKQKGILNGIARRWPERWYRGHKQYYATIHQIANCPLFFEGTVGAAKYFSLTANWAKAYPHIVLALSEGVETAPIVDKDASDLEIIRLAFPDIPAPIDWAKEIDHLLQVREKAIRAIKESFGFNEGHRDVTIEGGQWCVEYISAIIQMFPVKNPRVVYTGLACPLETLLLLAKAIAGK